MDERSGRVSRSCVERVAPWINRVVQLLLILSLVRVVGCVEGRVEGASGDDTSVQSVGGCTVSSVRYPTTEGEFLRLYAGRGFLVDGVHIGRDILLSEGTAIYPIACGTVRVYRAAQGYGTLVVVLEHHLPSAIMVRNGVGESVFVQDFLSIYGHLRATTSRTGGTRLPWRDGDVVRPDQIIGYVQHDADNGDGEEHLHLGVRLQSAADAARVDPSTWFAGYDSDRSRRRWYADPALFLTALLNRAATRSTATWHPPGTVLSIDGQTWFVRSEGVLARVPNDLLQSERLGARVVLGASAELACMTMGELSPDRTSGHRLVRFEGSSTVYEYTDTPSAVRYTFLAQQAFDSWGWVSTQIETRRSEDRSAFLARYRDVGARRLREGSLVKAAGRSDVYVVSEGRRRPIFDWPTFLALGYQESWIVEVDASVLDVLAGPQGDMIRPDDLQRCGMRPLMDAGVSGMDASMRIDVPAGVDIPVDATIDVPSSVDVFRGSMDAGVDVPVAVLDAGRDSGFDVPRVDVPRVEVDAGHCSDAGTPSIDAPVVRDAGGFDSGNPPPAGVIPPGSVMRYEFRLAVDSEGWRPTEPYHLRDHWWARIRCLNATGSDQTRMTAEAGGWFRCDTASVHRIFVGTFFSPSNQTLGDMGHIPTIENWPVRCHPRPGVEWRISELPGGREIYRGLASALPCVAVDAHDRHQLP